MLLAIEVLRFLQTHQNATYLWLFSCFHLLFENIKPLYASNCFWPSKHSHLSKFWVFGCGRSWCVLLEKSKNSCSIFPNLCPKIQSGLMGFVNCVLTTELFVAIKALTDTYQNFKPMINRFFKSIKPFSLTCKLKLKAKVQLYN